MSPTAASPAPLGPDAVSPAAAGPGAAVEVRLGPVDEIPLGEGRAYAAAGQQVAVFRLRSGAVHALSAVCPHRGGPLADGQLDDVVVMCPLHASTFELATGCSPSGERPVPVHPVRVDDAGVLVVTVPSAGR